MNRWWWQWPLTDRASWDHAPYQCDFATSTWSPFITHLWVALWIASLVSCFGQWNAAEVILLEFRSPGLSFSLCPLGRQPWNQQTVKELVWPPRGWEPCGGELKSHSQGAAERPWSEGSLDLPGQHRHQLRATTMRELRWDPQRSCPVSPQK